MNVRTSSQYTSNGFAWKNENTNFPYVCFINVIFAKSSRVVFLITERYEFITEKKNNSNKQLTDD